MPATPEDAEATMIRNLAEKTGKDLPAWLKVVSASRLTKHGEIVKLLKAEHGVTHGYANLIAHKALASDAGSAANAGDLVEAQYAGAKAALKPIYDALMKAIGAFGKDVEVAPKKAYVSLRRKKQFAILQPSTATRFDVGLNLKGVEPTARLEASGSYSAMCTHRVRVANLAEIDAELVGWLRRAYDQA